MPWLDRSSATEAPIPLDDPVINTTFFILSLFLLWYYIIFCIFFKENTCQMIKNMLLYVLSMAELVKGLTRWIVVPLCVGSSPTFRPRYMYFSMTNSTSHGLVFRYLFKITMDVVVFFYFILL